MASIRRVPASETFPLRRQVLRPHQSTDELSSAGVHFAAFHGAEVIGTAIVIQEASPWDPDLDGAPGWRLRGMATAEEWRNQGVGGALLQAVIAHVGDHGGGLLWCHARMAAVAFYQRNGFATRGEPWVEPIIGPHIAMAMRVAPPG